LRTAAGTRAPALGLSLVGEGGVLRATIGTLRARLPHRPPFVPVPSKAAIGARQLTQGVGSGTFPARRKSPLSRDQFTFEDWIAVMLAVSANISPVFPSPAQLTVAGVAAAIVAASVIDSVPWF
jgi:hypothetical protein